MDFDSWFTTQFDETLSEPLAQTDGMSEVEIDSALHGQVIPSSMRAYFRVAGRHWLNTHYNEWLPLGAFESAGDYIVFMEENQCVVRWAYRSVDRTATDPTVFQVQSQGEASEFYSEEMAFSQFIIAMWKWVLASD